MRKWIRSLARPLAKGELGGHNSACCSSEDVGVRGDAIVAAFIPARNLPVTSGGVGAALRRPSVLLAAAAFAVAAAVATVGVAAAAVTVARDATVAAAVVVSTAVLVSRHCDALA